LTHITIEIIGKGAAIAELHDRNPRIAEELLKKLPITGKVNLWGDEVYFEVPLELDNENASPTAGIGDISYWSPGPALCIFFGHTQPYSAVNHLGKVVDSLDLFKKVQEGDKIVLSRK
jgi:hypothetical protein